MNPEYFGDSYDIVKRFFIGILKDLKYTIHVDPMLQNSDNDFKRDFYKFLRVENKPIESARTALFIDPDTGIKIEGKKTFRHIGIDTIIKACGNHKVVFVFDQSFGRVKSKNKEKLIQKKLSEFSGKQVHGFYYNSHACFGFFSTDKNELEAVKKNILETSLPVKRIVQLQPLNKYKTMVYTIR